MNNLDRQKLFQNVENYIEKNYKPLTLAGSIPFLVIGGVLGGGIFSHTPSRTGAVLDSLLKLTEKTFTEMLLSIIENKGKKISEVYSKARITKQHFSKIKNNPDYQPSKNTALALVVACYECR